MIIKIKYMYVDTKRLEKIVQGDWIDLYADEDLFIEANEKELIDLGVAMQLPEGYEAHVAPRSSTFKTWGLLQTNSVAVIDNSYCGDEDWWRYPVLATRDTHVKRGDKICQFRIIKKQPEFDFEEVEFLGNENRGGFGSTGSK